MGLSHSYNDRVNKPEKGKPMVRSLMYLAPELNSNFSLRFLRGDTEVKAIPLSSSGFSHTPLIELEKPDNYKIKLTDDSGKLQDKLLHSDVPLKLGGVYTFVGAYVPKPNGDLLETRMLTITKPNSLHMAWMMPQYIIITMAEVMFSITGLQFAFTQAPESMKSLLQAAWLLSVAFGNLIVVLVTQVKFFERQVGLIYTRFHHTPAYCSNLRVIE